MTHLHDADRLALNLLDARLQALSDGATKLPPPQVPACPDGRPGAAGDLVRRTLDQLHRIPREPADAFGLRVRTLLLEFRSRRCPWNAAAIRLLDDVYAFVSTGPRRHADWKHDVLAVMNRRVRDPRGWVRLDGDRAEDTRWGLPAYPFDPPAVARWPDLLYPLEAEAAHGALAVMTEEWQAEPRPVRGRPDRDAVLADARTLLDRYGPTARYWTNARAAAHDRAPDFVAAGLQGTASHTFLTSAYVRGLDLFDDLGLIAVGDEEVGVFWSIGAY
ncbi:hypothetical protein OG444_36120 [Streptomyces sp. NBC_01232]|uniref:hypothetical protein n=1 Tax=Streptomyces sp. NBC_01232 TaxID=2903786 RepID=UPI002E12B472|nr:hypothetical protein OG444_36120 [Streptomyces sp. NBC_01232]